MHPKIQIVKKFAANSASSHIYNVQTKGVQHKAMVKPLLKTEGYTSWSTQHIASY